MPLPPDAMPLDDNKGLPPDAIALEQAPAQDQNDSFMQKLGKSAETGLQSAYAESIAPVVHGASTLALGIPKAVAAQTGTKDMIYPEQTTPEGKALRFASEGAGYALGGAVKGGQLILRQAAQHIPQLLETAGGNAVKELFKKSTRGFIAGTSAGALQTPDSGDLANPQGRLNQAETMGGLGVAAPLLGPAMSALKPVGSAVVGAVAKSGKWVAKNFSGVSDATVKIIKDLGADRVFDPAKANIDYIGKEIVPKVKARVVNALVNISDKTSPTILKALGISPDDIDTLSKVDKGTLSELQSVFGGDWNAVQKGIGAIKEKAKAQFDSILGSHPEGELIPAKNTYSSMEKILKENNWIDSNGREIKGSGVANRAKSNLVKIFNYLGKNPNADISVKQYYGVLNDLDATLADGDSGRAFNRLVYKIQGSLRDDATNAIDGLKEANKTWKDAMSLSDLEHVFNKVDDSLKLENAVMALKNVGRFQYHEKYKELLGKTLHDDLLAHLANQDFNLVSDIPKAGGSIAASRSGLLKSGITGATKAYYKDVAPALGSANKYFKSKISPAKDYFNKSISGQPPANKNIFNTDLGGTGSVGELYGQPIVTKRPANWTSTRQTEWPKQEKDKTIVDKIKELYEPNPS